MIVKKPKIAIIGSGGREHALAWKFANSLGQENVFTLPGNGGIYNSFSIDISDFNAIKDFCLSKDISMIFVGPEQALSDGIVDYFKDTGIRVLGPSRKAAQLESSKIFAKEFMQKHGVSTADFKVFHHIEDAFPIIKEKKGDLVIKFDGLAGGKGVFVCSNEREAIEALEKLKEKYGENVDFLIEDKISGDEISIIGFTDGKSIKTLQISQDHKQVFEKDKGPNTGGMGAYSPIRIDESLQKEIEKNIIQPTLKGIKAERFNYHGVIYFGIMVKEGKAYLLEYNVRFGDPETQVLLPALKTDLYEISKACVEESLDKIDFAFKDGYFADVVLVSGGYPGKYETGKIIKGLDEIEEDVLIFHAGTTKENEKLFTSGGRVLNIVAQGATLEKALEKAYRNIDKISFEGMYYRKDIGQRKNTELKTQPK